MSNSIWLYKKRLTKATRRALAMPNARLSALVCEIFSRYPESKAFPNRYAVLEWFVHKYGALHHEPAPRRAQEMDGFLRSSEWRSMRMRVIKSRGARCECCGARPTDGRTVIHVDHVKPRRYFPELALVESNLQVLCEDCNIGKGSWDRTDWRSRERQALPRLVKRVGA